MPSPYTMRVPTILPAAPGMKLLLFPFFIDTFREYLTHPRVHSRLTMCVPEVSALLSGWKGCGFREYRMKNDWVGRQWALKEGRNT